MNTDATVRFLLGMGLAALFSGAPVGLDARQMGDVLITGGTLIEQSEPPRVLDILFSRQDLGLVVEAISHAGILQATDTIDLSGSYLHTANTMSAMQPFEVGGYAMYVVRTGPSQGHAARMVILPSRMHLVEWTSNFPEGPMHDAVGCYSVEHGPWDRPASQPAEERFSVPGAIQIHWQYLLHHGRENVLAATDGDGGVPKGANLFAWSPMDGDSIQIHLHDNYVGLAFRLQREESGYVGTVSRFLHSGDGSTWPQASTRLVLTTCIPSQETK